MRHRLRLPATVAEGLAAGWEPELPNGHKAPRWTATWTTSLSARSRGVVHASVPLWGDGPRPSRHRRAEPKPWQPVTVWGYASTFFNRYSHCGRHEFIEAGAFTDWLARRPEIYALLEHDIDQFLGETGDNLSVVEDDYGLVVRLHLPEHTPAAADLVDGIRRGRVSGMSLHRPQWQAIPEQRGLAMRTMSVEEVSFTDRPGNPATFCLIAEDERGIVPDSAVKRMKDLGNWGTREVTRDRLRWMALNGTPVPTFVMPRW